MKKQLFALILLSILVLTLITGCNQRIADDSGDTSDDDSDTLGNEVLDNLDDDLIDENDSIELGDLI